MILLYQTKPDICKFQWKRKKRDAMKYQTKLDHHIGLIQYP